MKIDTSKIEGYSDMSAEDKLKALEGYDIEVPATESGEVAKLRTALDKATSEAASYKKALREKQTAEEAQAAAEAEERKKMVEELDALRRKETITGYKASFMELGFDAEAAGKTAEALHAGDFATVFANNKAFIEASKKAAATAALDSQPNLTNGNPATASGATDAFTAEMRRFAGLK